MSIVTLVSGGLDSTLVALLTRDAGIQQHPLFIDYGQRAKTLELVLKDQAGGYEPLYNNLQAEAEHVFAAIDGIKTAPTGVEVTPPMDIPIDLDQLVTALEELEARLSEGDPDTVSSTLDHALTLGLSAALPQDCTRLQALVDDFDFFTAVDLVVAMRAQLINPQQT